MQRQQALTLPHPRPLRHFACRFERRVPDLREEMDMLVAVDEIGRAAKRGGERPECPTQFRGKHRAGKPTRHREAPSPRRDTV
jgi:hypothetical protein